FLRSEISFFTSSDGALTLSTTPLIIAITAIIKTIIPFTNRKIISTNIRSPCVTKWPFYGIYLYGNYVRFTYLQLAVNFDTIEIIHSIFLRARLQFLHSI